jgi:hypothetical protein
MMSAIGVSGGGRVPVAVSGVVDIDVVSVVVVGEVVVVVAVVVTGSSTTVIMTVSIRLYPDESSTTRVRL